MLWLYLYLPDRSEQAGNGLCKIFSLFFYKYTIYILDYILQSIIYLWHILFPDKSEHRVSFRIFLTSYIFIRFLRVLLLLESILVIYILLGNYFYHNLYILPFLIYFTIFNILKFFPPNIFFSGHSLYNQVICFGSSFSK